MSITQILQLSLISYLMKHIFGNSLSPVPSFLKGPFGNEPTYCCFRLSFIQHLPHRHKPKVQFLMLPIIDSNDYNFLFKQLALLSFRQNNFPLDKWANKAVKNAKIYILKTLWKRKTLQKDSVASVEVKRAELPASNQILRIISHFP